MVVIRIYLDYASGTGSEQRNPVMSALNAVNFFFLGQPNARTIRISKRLRTESWISNGRGESSRLGMYSVSLIWCQDRQDAIEPARNMASRIGIIKRALNLAHSCIAQPDSILKPAKRQLHPCSALVSQIPTKEQVHRLSRSAL